MSLGEHYNELWNSAIKGFEIGNFETDPLIDFPEDNRFGMTMVIRPDRKVKESMAQMLQELSLLEPSQYFYPVADMHITVMSVISCYPGFSLTGLPIAAYVGLVQEAVQGIPSFDILFKGITASPSCVMVQGFPSDDSLQQLRTQLRKKFKGSSLMHRIDVRYAIRTAHCTVLRFKTPLSNPTAFLDKLQHYRTFDFGTSTISQAELVFNDWYQRQKFVQQLGKFEFESLGVRKLER